MNVSEYIFDFFYKKGVRAVFQLVGGGSMYLNDAVSKSKMEVINCHHEQACAYAAVGYTKLSGKPSICLTTTGCGATNTITGLLDAWQDSVPIIFISGQVKTKDINPELRQSGVQGAEIFNLVKNYTKCVISLRTNLIEYPLEDIYDQCISDRKGPVWIEIPLDIQSEGI